MRAEFDGQDYMLFLAAAERELEKLRREKLEARLKQAWEPDNDLGKIVRLELAENQGMDGIELKYIPEGVWEKIREVRIKVNSRAYEFIRERGSFGTRYNGSDKVEIVVEN